MSQRVNRRCMSLAAMVLAAGMLLGTTGVARSDTRYRIQPIVKLGDSVAGINVRLNGGVFAIYGLTDRGQITFATSITEPQNGGATLQYADGKFTPIGVSGGEGPVGTWPVDLTSYDPAAVNQLGNFVFAGAKYNNGNPIGLGVFFWEAQSQKWTVVARKGMPAGSDLILETTNWFAPSINNRDEIAFAAAAKNAAGELLRVGIFRAAPAGPIVPVAVPGQALPEGRTLGAADNPILNDAGMIGFRGNRKGDPEDGRNHAYLWENGSILELVAARMDAPGGGKFARIQRAWVNDANRSVLILARLNDPQNGPASLYRWADGVLTPVAVPGQEMPGGGQFGAVTLIHYGVSPPNRLGQHAFIATLADGATAAYRIEADGKLSLILKSGAVTDLGTITQIARKSFTPGLTRDGSGIGLNSQGQVALPVQIDGGPFTIVLLTPVAE